MYKKLLALLATGCLGLSSSVSVLVEVADSKDKLNEIKISKITAAIRFVEDDKAAYGLEDVDFNTLELGAGITTYEYKNGDFCALGEVFPIFADGSIVASAIGVGDGSYCIETSLAHNINSTNCVEAAIVYDRDKAYLFDGSDFVLLRKSSICVPGRDDIDDALVEQTKHHIVTSCINDHTRVNFSPEQKQTRVLPYVSCDVKYVTQLPYDELCWAACIAMVKNYLSGTRLTVESVSKRYFGTSYVVNEAISTTSMQYFMRNTCGLDYTYKSTAPTGNIILNNLSNNYPVVGIFGWNYDGMNVYHAGVIVKCNPFSNYITVYDPAYDAVGAPYSNGAFSYVNPDSGITLTLDSGLCNSWS